MIISVAVIGLFGSTIIADDWHIAYHPKLRSRLGHVRYVNNRKVSDLFLQRDHPYHFSVICGSAYLGDHFGQKLGKKIKNGAGRRG